MLVLTRKSQQQIRFGSDIVVTVLQISGDRVRIGIEAPRSVRVIRGELATTPPREKTSRREPTSSEAEVSPLRLRQLAGESSGLFPRLRRRTERACSQGALLPTIRTAAIAAPQLAGRV